MLPKIEFKMAAILKMATKTKFACKNYKLSFFKKKFRAVLVAKIPSFIEKKISQKFKMAPMFNMEIFFWHLFLRAFIIVRNFKMVKFLHILKEQTQKKI
jgi:hypothetical protein